MSQESAHDFIQMAKDYARAEKELEVQKWCYIQYERTTEDGRTEKIFNYDLPREILDRKEWVIRWRWAKLICQYPKGNVQYYVSFYDKRLGNNPEFTECLHRLANCKAQVTRMKRIIKSYLDDKKGDLFFDERTDKDLQRARKKLARKEADVEATEYRMKLKIQQIKENKQ